MHLEHDLNVSKPLQKSERVWVRRVEAWLANAIETEKDRNKNKTKKLEKR